MTNAVRNYCFVALATVALIGAGYYCQQVVSDQLDADSSCQQVVSDQPLPARAKFDTVEANRFVLKDDKGVARAVMEIDTNNVARMRMGRKEGQNVFLLSVFPDGRAALILRDDRGRNRIAMSIRKDGWPALSLTENANILLKDDRGRLRTALRMPNDGNPRLTF